MIRNSIFERKCINFLFKVKLLLLGKLAKIIKLTTYTNIIKKIFSAHDTVSFNETALEIFQYQYQNNPVYNKFCQLLGKSPLNVSQIETIPFLPVEFFKKLKVITGKMPVEIVFKSSATTGMGQSHHYVSDLSIYIRSYLKSFELFYGKPSDYCILALLPSYMEREGSSLVLMIDDLVKKSKNRNSGFYLHNTEDLIHKIKILEAKGQKTLLIGVTFALINLAEKCKLDLKTTLVMETGGMKGRRKEMIREEVHKILSNAFKVPKIHSEYGMTELLSQAYSSGNGFFKCPPWMKVMIRDAHDPLTYMGNNKGGGINIIDFANINSCAFISTQDLGKSLPDGSFEVLGRFDNSDIRGCNLLA